MKDRSLLHYLVIAVAIALVFANSLHGDYHLDSIYRVEQNSNLEQLFPLHRHFIDPATSATLGVARFFVILAPSQLFFNP